jgi:heme/copper-type cytochrome/quinol oxidase subunit 2
MEQQIPQGQPHDTTPMSMKDWFITLLISYIPLVGLIMLIIWAFDSSTNVNKKNWAKASLLWMLIGIGIAIIIVVLFMSVFLGALSSMQS